MRSPFLIEHFLTITLALGALVSAPARGAACDLRSPPHRLGMLELYTSEGCNSCPPADRWLSRIRSSHSDRQLIPLAFHVDYWDQLGWPDRFSRNQYTKRQQQASDRNRAEFVYTPQFLLDGKDIRPVHADGVLNTRLAPINKEAARAQITAQVTLSAAREIALQGTATLTQTNTTAETFIVLYENGISSKVAAGENAGKTLQHDFVVRALVGPIFSSAQGVAKLEHRIPLPADARINALGVAVFTQDAATGIVLQVAAAENCFTP